MSSSKPINQLKSAVKKFKDACSRKKLDIPKCVNLLENAKIELLNFELLPPFDNGDEALTKQVLHLARDVYEQATLLSIRSEDYDSFSRHVEQVKVFYYDYNALLEPSKLQWPIMGLKLMSLLIDNSKLSDFHVEIELIPIDIRNNNEYIRFPVELEQVLMEGSYRKLFGARKTVPMNEYSFFMNNLTTTVREKVASSMEFGYTTMSIADAMDMLTLSSENETREYAKQRHWNVDDNNMIIFPRTSDKSLDIPAMKLISQTLHYACEMERII